MKKTFTFLCIILIIPAVLLSCKKKKEDDKLDSSSANFTYTKIGNGGITVTISNGSAGNDYSWDFGDGRGSAVSSLSDTKYATIGKDEYSRTYYYKTNGTHAVTLSVSNPNKGNLSSSQSVSISDVPTKAKLKYFKLKDYPTLNPANNAAWDSDGTDPDIYFSWFVNSVYGKSANPYLNTSKTILPLQLNIDTVFVNVNTINVSDVVFSTLDYDNATTSDVITTITFLSPQEHTSQGVSYSSLGDNSTMYPSVVSNIYLEVGLEWEP